MMVANEVTKRKEDPPATRSPGSMLMAHGIAWGLYLAILVFGVPWAETAFVDFGVPLPRTTVLVIQASRGAVVIVPLFLLLVTADWLMLSGRFASRMSQ